MFDLSIEKSLLTLGCVQLNRYDKFDTNLRPLEDAIVLRQSGLLWKPLADSLCYIIQQTNLRE